MKTIKLISFFAAALLCFVSCDKIDSDKYVVFAGSNGEWYDSQEDIPNVQRAFVEKYTGVRCVNCPFADDIIHASSEKYGDNLVVVAVHAPNNFGKPLGNDPDLRTEKGGTWYNAFFSVSQGLPCALLNRADGTGNLDVITPTASFDDKIDAALAQSPKVNMMMSSSKEGDKYAVDVHLGFAQTVSDELTLTVLVIEDKIYVTQMKTGEGEIENYEQNHVLRDIITDAWGIDVDANGNAGTKRKVRLTYELRSDCNPDNCHLIAFVSDKATKKVLNAAECELR